MTTDIKKIATREEKPSSDFLGLLGRVDLSLNNDMDRLRRLSRVKNVSFERALEVAASLRLSRSNAIDKIDTHIRGRPGGLNFSTVLRMRAVILNFSRQLEVQENRFQDLLEVDPTIPEQKDAPLQAGVVDNVLSLEIGGPPEPKDEDYEYEPELSYLIVQARQSVADLNTSNCPRRVVAAFELLWDLLNNLTPTNAVRVFLHTRTLDGQVSALRDELPDHLLASLIGLLTNTRDFVNQFKAVDRFRRNASPDINPNVLGASLPMVDNAIKSLEGAPDSVDIKVPATLRWIWGLVTTPGQTAKETFHALVFSIENVAIALAKFVAATAAQVGKGVGKGAAGATALVVGGALIALSATFFADLGPLAALTNELSWLKGMEPLLKVLLKGGK